LLDLKPPDDRRVHVGPHPRSLVPPLSLSYTHAHICRGKGRVETVIGITASKQA